MFPVQTNRTFFSTAIGATLFRRHAFVKSQWAGSCGSGEVGYPRLHSGVKGVSDQIGEQLREARESAGLAVDDVVFKTRIPRSVVASLEMGDFSAFSSPTYARSFLSQYSEFLRVDARYWLDAMEPVFYQLNDAGMGVLKSSHPDKVFKGSEHKPRSGWFAAISTLALTCGLVYLAVMGYEHLEIRYGGDVQPASGGAQPTLVSPESTSPTVNPVVEKPVMDPRLDDFAEPPLRATIVRDGR